MSNSWEQAVWLDAQRYRYLRGHAQYAEGWAPHVLTDGHNRGHAPEFLVEDELDEAVDQAIKRQGLTHDEL